MSLRLYRRIELLSKKTLTEKQKDEICKIEEKFIKIPHTYLKVLIHFIEHEFENLLDRYIKYVNIKNKKANTLENYIIRHGVEEGTMLYEDKNKRCASTLENFILKYGEELGRIKYIETNKLKGGSLESFIKRYGNRKGTRKYKEFCKNNSGNLTLERFIKKYGEEIGRTKFIECQEKLNKRFTLERFIEKYGKAEGTRFFNEKLSKLHYGASLEGFIDKYGNDAKIKLRYCKDNVSKESFIERYGKEDGTGLYKEFINKIGCTLEKFIKKYGEVEGTIRYDKWKEGCSIKFGAWSKISQELFWQIFKKIKNDFKIIYFATNDNGIRNDNVNKEFKVFYNTKNYLKLDFYIPEINFSIEFDGSFWHQKHILEKSGRFNDVERDTIIQNQLKDIKIIHIKEKAFNKNKDNIVDSCIKEIYDRKKFYES